MTGASSIATCRYIRRPSGRSGTLTFDLSALKWGVHGPIPASGLSDQGKDLVEVSRVVHEVDRSMPRRITTERTQKLSVAIAVREPEVWTAKAKEHLAQLLYVQGGAEWEFTFTKRKKTTTGLDELYAGQLGKRILIEPGTKNAVILFSGGLDSTSGLAALQPDRKRCVLVGAFSRNLGNQQAIAKTLGYPDLIQIQGVWNRAGGGAKVGGQFQHRSFYYLSLGAAFADALRVETLYQFENGPLALAVPPAPLYRMTRHAHPTVHREAEALVAEVLRHSVTILNPFLGKTKRQAVSVLLHAVPKKTLRKLLVRTETCWNIRATSVVGAGPKDSKTPCGTCIPCIVRRTALGVGEKGYAVDLTSPNDANASKEVVRVHLNAYMTFARRVLSKDYGVGNLMRDMPEVTEVAIFEDRALTPEEALGVYRTFASEILDVFKKVDFR